MSGRAWELQDVRLGPGGGPLDDVIIVGGVPVSVMTPGEALDVVQRKMREHVNSGSSVEGVRIVDENGVIQARWTNGDVIQERSRSRGR